MYAQIFFVTSVRGAVFTPHTAARASESFFGALSDAFVAFVMVGFFVAVVLTVVFVVIAIE